MSAYAGARVTTEINCRCDTYEHPTNPIFTRNHAPNRVVLGIIAKDGVLAECVPSTRPDYHVEYLITGSGLTEVKVPWQP